MFDFLAVEIGWSCHGVGVVFFVEKGGHRL